MVQNRDQLSTLAEGSPSGLAPYPSSIRVTEGLPVANSHQPLISRVLESRLVYMSSQAPTRVAPPICFDTKRHTLGNKTREQHGASDLVGGGGGDESWSNSHPSPSLPTRRSPTVVRRHARCSAAAPARTYCGGTPQK